MASYDAKKENATGHFDRLNNLVDGGLLATLTGAEVKVLIVYLKHADDDGIAWPGPATIAKRTGLHLWTVNKAIANLTNRGMLITVTPGGGRAAGGKQGFPAHRRVVIPDTTASGRGLTDTDTPAVECEYPRRGARKPPPVGCANPRLGASGTTHRTNQRTHQQQQAADAAGGGGDVVVPSAEEDPQASAVRKALIDAEIHEPTRSRLLSEIPGLTAAVVTKLRLANTGGTGVLVNLIRHEGPRLVGLDAERRAEVAWKEARQREVLSHWTARYDADPARIEAAIVKMKDNQTWDGPTRLMGKIFNAVDLDSPRPPLSESPHRKAVFAMLIDATEADVPESVPDNGHVIDEEALDAPTRKAIEVMGSCPVPNPFRQMACA